jgi:coproporphyrinogen III oxidase
VQRECDEYFFIPARGEHRGVGGIFFDDLSALDEPSSSSTSSGTGGSSRGLDAAMAFTQAVCEAWMPSYLPIVRQVRHNGHLAPHFARNSPRLPVCVCQRRHVPYTDTQRHWQLLRRGRYIEFNMLYDRGVKYVAGALAFFIHTAL